jgi:signal transduction histidine kinase
MEYIKVLKETSESTNELLNNLLQWTKAELGTMEVNPEPVRMTDIVAKTIKLLDIKIKNKNLSVVNEMPPALHVYADPNLVSSIIRNLTTNAVKFTADNGTIKFAGARGKKNGCCRAFVSVADTGIGIAPESIEKLFTINNQSSIKFGTAGESGSGLGLLICREFAELSGGSVTAASEAGKGSVFTLELPAAEA